MLTLEFKLSLTDEQKQSVCTWMDLSGWQWNVGLSALKEYDRFTRLNQDLDPLTDKKIWQKSIACPIAEGTWVKAVEIEEELTTGSLESKSRYLDIIDICLTSPKGFSAPTCPLFEIGAQVQDPKPRITSSELQHGGDSLGTMARADRIPEPLREIPAKFRMGILALLNESWKRYVAERATNGWKGEPRFKRRSDAWDVLYSPNLKAELKINGDRLKGLPKLGEVFVPHLARRWRDANGEIPPICAVKIVRRFNRFYLQLTGDLKKVYKPVDSTSAVGIDLGFVYGHADSNGGRSPLFSPVEDKLERQKKALQSALDDKINQRLILWLHHPNTTLETCRSFIKVSLETWNKLKQCRTAGEVCQVIGQKRDKRYMILRSKLPRTQAEIKLRRQIKQLDRRMAMTRKDRDEKLSTRIARKHKFVAIENGLQREQLRHRPEPIPEGSGFASNGAAMQSESNKQMRSLAPGQKIAMMNRKTDRYGGKFVKASSVRTTSECPCCGATNEPSLEFEPNGDRLYSCPCGWTIDQDLNAAINIELRSFASIVDVKLSHFAEMARVRSYQLENDGYEMLKPSWRNEPVESGTKAGSRTKKRKASSNLKDSPAGGKTPIQPASRKSQLESLKGGRSGNPLR